MHPIPVRSMKFDVPAADAFDPLYLAGSPALSYNHTAFGLYDHRRTHPAFGALFKWHMLEEIEHRTVAFDLYQHLFGGSLFRARLCWVAQGHMLRFQRRCAELMSEADARRRGPRHRIGARQRLTLATFPIGMRLRSMRPGYTPRQHHVPEAIAKLSAHFTEVAQSVR